MDKVTKFLLDEFVKSNTLESLGEDTQFEYFCGTLITSHHYFETFQPEEIAVGAGGDLGIDCISILVNGRLVSDPEELSELIESQGYLDVTFIFVQAERSSSFDGSKIGNFGYGVQDFFSEEPKLVHNQVTNSGRVR